MLVISFPFAFIYGYVYFTPVLMLYLPDHRCANASQTIGQCQMYSEKGHLVDCPYSYEYNTMGLFETAITDYDWVCDNGWIPPYTQAMFFLGAAKLPLTVEEEEDFGIDQSLFTIPFLCRRKKMAGYFNNGYSDSPAIVTLTAINKLDC